MDRTLKFLLLAAVSAAAAACSPGAREEGGAESRALDAGDAPRDSASILADLLVETSGGNQAWKDTRFVSFRWIVEREGEVVADRAHAWDRHDSRYRLEFERGGTHTLALFDIQSMKHDSIPPAGDVWVDGRKLEAAARDSALERAYSTFINDSYWLLMPLKWRDPGVHLAYEGRRQLSDGRSYGVVHLTYDQGLGVTEDEFWGFVDPETGRMAAWQYHLEGRDEKGPVIWWRDWQQVGPLLLAMDRRWDEGTTRIYFADVAASHEIPEGAFAPPAP